MLHVLTRYAIGVFIISISLGTVASAIPLILAIKFSANELEVGLLGALPALPYILSCSLFGKLSDKIGRRPILFFGSIFYSTASLLYIVCNEALNIMMLRIIEGLALAMIWPIMDAIFGDLSNKMASNKMTSNKIASNKVISIYNASWSLGFMMGSMFMGIMLWLSDINIAFIITSILGIIGIMAFYDVREYNVLESEKFNKFKEKQITIMFYNMFILGFSLFSFYSLFPLYALNHNIDEHMVGCMIGTVALTRTITFLLYGKIHSNYALSIGSILLGASMFLLWAFPSLMGFFMAAILLGISVGLIYSYSLNLIASLSSKGLYAGVLESAVGLGEFIGPLTMGALGFLISSNSPYLFMFTMAISSILLNTILNTKLLNIPRAKPSV
ncbi:MAG: MFS transporter [Candidatus Methanomethyliaceae archaeon]|nr:MFS transporter [Candidatus Methanomethyliaceae archaeon]MDW7971552.1 MFS transporter [Nitrososphaerota archaeon]